MKVFDCCLFLNEMELLELRLAELAEVVDYFVIAEASVTHLGQPKPFRLEENMDRYEEYLDKIVYVKVEDAPAYDPADPYRVVHFQRDAIMRGLAPLARPGDRIMLSDLDEIPDPEIVKANLDKPNWVHLQNRLYYYYVNLQCHRPFGGTVIGGFGSFRYAHHLRTFAVRRLHYDARKHPEVIGNAGWHYSYLGDADRIREKLASMADAPKVLPQVGNVEDRLRDHKDLFGRDHKYQFSLVDIQATQPRHMPAFLKKYPHLYYNPECEG